MSFLFSNLLVCPLERGPGMKGRWRVHGKLSEDRSSEEICRYCVFVFIDNLLLMEMRGEVGAELGRHSHKAVWGRSRLWSLNPKLGSALRSLLECSNLPPRRKGFWLTLLVLTLPTLGAQVQISYLPWTVLMLHPPNLCCPRAGDRLCILQASITDRPFCHCWSDSLSSNFHFSWGPLGKTKEKNEED